MGYRAGPNSDTLSRWHMYSVYVLAAALLFTAGGVAMKASAGMTRLAPTVLFLALFAAGAAFQALALRNAELGIAYVAVLGLETVLAAALGVLIFSERVSAPKCLGVFAVTVGIVLLHLGESAPPPAPAVAARSAGAEAD